MRMLRARLHALAQEEAAAEASDARRRRSARSTAPSASAHTTSRRTASPTTASATRPTTSTRCSTATWTRWCSLPRRRRGRPAGRGLGTRMRHPPAHARRAGRGERSAGWPRPGAEPRVDAELLAAHVLGAAPRVVRSPLGGPPAPVGYDALVAERAARVPLQHLTGERRSVTSTWRSGRVSSCPGPRPRRRRRRDRRGSTAEPRRAARSSTCARFGGHRPGRRDRGPQRSRRGRGQRPRRSRWAEPNVDGLAPGRVDLRAGDATRRGRQLADSTAASTSWSATRRTSPTGPAARPRCATTTPRRALRRQRDGLAVPRAVAAWPPRCCARAALLVIEHADSRGSRPLALDPQLWSDRQDHGGPGRPPALRDRSPSLPAQERVK